MWSFCIFILDFIFKHLRHEFLCIQFRYIPGKEALNYNVDILVTSAQLQENVYMVNHWTIRQIITDSCRNLYCYFQL